MRKRTAVLNLLLVSIVALLPLAMIGLRDVLLRQVDCLSCRRILTLIAQPSDYNAPVAISRVENGVSHFYLFPRYVGRYLLQAYEISGGSEPSVLRLKCSEDFEFSPVSGKSKQNEVSSRFGRGLILGDIRILPEQVMGKDRISCDINITSTENILLVITRASEL